MRWPWQPKPEKRQAAPYTDAVAAAILADAGGADADGDPAALGALETASGLWGRGLAMGAVTPSTAAAMAVTPGVLQLTGRELCRRGEAVFAIGVDRAGTVRLLPAGSWDVRGGPDPETWWYRLDLFGASDHATRVLPAANVVHVRYAVDPARPWLGISPLGAARDTGKLAANLERRLGQEAGSPVGGLLAVPVDPGGEDDAEDAGGLGALNADLRGAKGKTVLVETTAAGWGEGKGAAPLSDWKPSRFGANPPAPLATLRSDAALSVLAACGIPPSLVALPADGTGQREAWRRFLHGTIAPLAELVRMELADKLDIPGLAIGFDRLFASDLSGRARAFQSMVNGGMDPAKAAGLAGLMEQDDAA